MSKAAAPKAETKADSGNNQVTISPVRAGTARFPVHGISPYMQNRFSHKQSLMMRERMESGSTSKKGRTRAARDFSEDCREATYISSEGWPGIPATAFRNACISACRLVGFKMTLGKLSLRIVQDGMDDRCGTPLVRFTADTPPPEESILAVRLVTGVIDLRSRPVWKQWRAVVTVWFDRDQFTLEDVTNLLSRAGQQVGIGEGRPDSKNSPGIGYGLFEIEGE